MKKEIIGTYFANHALSCDLLSRLTEEELDKKWERPGLDTFRKHFLEIISVQDAFENAIRTKDMSFDSVPSVFAFNDTISKNEIIKRMKKSDERLLDTIEKSEDTLTVHWFDMNISIYSHLSNLIQHEIFHQGMMLIMLYKFNIKVPDSWIENWALPQN